jgi:hypothetical protein
MCLADNSNEEGAENTRISKSVSLSSFAFLRNWLTISNINTSLGTTEVQRVQMRRK